MSPLDDPPPPDQQVGAFGKYALIDRLGRGGMADVWRARIAGPQGFQRVLVLKRILPHLVEDPRARELFEREARVISRLSHANIVKVFEFGEIDGEYFLTMEYVDGRDLAAIIRIGAASPGLAALVLRDVCRALAYAHSLRDGNGQPLRIIHRDVSPSNVMVGHDGAVRLLDFGIAKAFADPRDKRTVKGTIRGKFGYIAPEVIDGDEPDGRANLFSVGVVLHETLSGKRLFRGNSDLETLSLVKRAQIPPPSTMNPAVPPELEAICMKALERDRNKRYSSGDEMAEALDHVVHELRFGPNQLTEVLTRYFGGGRSPDEWQLEDSGPRTINEMPVVSPGQGTARDFEDEGARATKMMESQVVEKLARESRPTVDAANRSPSSTQKPTVAESRKQGKGQAPVDAPASRAGLLYLIGGVLAGSAITGVLLLTKKSGGDTAVTPPRPIIAAPDLAPRAVDAASPVDLGHKVDAASDPEEGKLIFPHDDDLDELARKVKGKPRQ